MPIYDRPTKSLMADWAKENLSPGQIFNKSEPIKWFAQHYPKIKPNTVTMHVDGMSVNNPVRKHHPSIRPGSGHDLFVKLGPHQFRLWIADNDGPPRYKEDFEKAGAETPITESDEVVELEDVEAGREFAQERDLQNYLVKNLGLIEPGLKLYEEEGITGIEFDAGGRRIDILAVDKAGGFVVIELKVSRGHDRVVGQILRYMTWVEQNMGRSQAARGVIVANEISNDLKLAASRIPDIKLVEYEISFKLQTVTLPQGA